MVQDLLEQLIVAWLIQKFLLSENPKIHINADKILALYSTVSQFNPVNTFTV
jgi:hypothetical protein